MSGAHRQADGELTRREPTHVGHVSDLDHVDPVAEGDVSPEYANEVKADNSLADYSDHAELLASESIDSVSSCTPNGTGADRSIDSIETGVDVLDETPLDISLDRAKVCPELTLPSNATGTGGQIRDVFDATRDDRIPVVEGTEAPDSIELAVAADDPDPPDRTERLEAVRQHEVFP